MAYPLTEENLKIHTDSLPRNSTMSGFSTLSSKSMPIEMEDPDTIPTISGKDILMAFGGTPQAYVKKDEGVTRVCNCLTWSRLCLFFLNFVIWLSGLTLVGFGAWVLVDGAGIGLFRHLFLVPGILLITTGGFMVVVGICGWIGALRQYILCLRVYMGLVLAVFVLQLATGAMAFFMLDHIERDMVYHSRKAIMAYGNPYDPADTDRWLDKLQSKFECCGGSSLADWETNSQYDCTSNGIHKCGVPKSCCRAQSKDCGLDVRDGPLEYTEMYVYTDGCVVILMDFVREHIKIIAAITFSMCILEIFALILAGMVIKFAVYHKTLLG